MAIVTGISLQRRDPSQCSIYVDKQFVCAISALDVSALGLRIGLEITEQALHELQERAQSSKCYKTALNYLATRVRSRQEIRLQLERKGFDAPDIVMTLERLEKSGLTNDQEFATLWVNDRMNLRPRSRRQLEQELAAKGVERSIIAQALQAVQPEDALAALRQVIEKKRRVGYSDDRKLTQYLMRQGYQYDQIKAVLTDLAETT